MSVSEYMFKKVNGLPYTSCDGSVMGALQTDEGCYGVGCFRGKKSMKQLVTKVYAKFTEDPNISPLRLKVARYLVAIYEEILPKGVLEIHDQYFPEFKVEEQGKRGGRIPFRGFGGRFKKINGGQIRASEPR